MYGELIGNGKYFLTDKPLTINFYGDTWRVVKLDENNLWVRAVSLQSKEFKGEEDVEYRYSRH